MSPSLWRHATGQRRARRFRRGQSLVEFALVVPVFLFLLAGAIDFGRLFYTYIEVTNAAREGAAYAAAAQINANSVTSADRADPANIQFRARQELGGDAGLSVSRTCSVAACAPSATGTGTEVTVTASRPFSFLTPFMSALFGGTVTLAASATAVIL